MVILIYSMGTLLCLLLLLGLVCLAVGVWQDFTGEHRERKELEARVHSQQDEIEELQGKLDEAVRLLDKTMPFRAFVEGTMVGQKSWIK